MIKYAVVFKSNNRVSEYGSAFEVPEFDSEVFYSAEISTDEFIKLLSMDTSKYEAYWDGDNQTVNLQKKAYLKLTTDATDNDGDGIPDILADGSSTATIYVKKYNSDDTLDANFNETIDLAVLRGKLSAVKITLTNGEGQVILTSAAETVLSIVRGSYGELVDGTVQIFFRPS